MSVSHPSVASDLPARDRDKDTKIIDWGNINLGIFLKSELEISIS